MPLQRNASANSTQLRIEFPIFRLNISMLGSVNISTQTYSALTGKQAAVPNVLPSADFALSLWCFSGMLWLRQHE